MINGAPVNALDYGADPTGVNDSTTAIQSAMDNGKVVYLPAGTYKITSLRFKNDNTVLIGDGQKRTYLSSTITSGSVLYNPDKATVTRYYCGIKGMQIAAVTTNNIVDWQSMQFGFVKDVWIYGTTKTTQTGLYMGAVWTTTECTYNEVDNAYIGAVAYGVRFGDGANTNTLRNIRVQPGASGYGYHLAFGGAAGRISNNTFISCHCEYPGNTVTGYALGQGSEGTTIVGARLEGLADAIKVTVDALETTIIGCYFSSNTVKIDNDSLTTTIVSNGCINLNRSPTANYDVDLVINQYPGAREVFNHVNGGEHSFLNSSGKGFGAGVYSATYGGGTTFGVGANGGYIAQTGGKLGVGTTDANALHLGSALTTRAKIQPNGCVNFVPLAADPAGGVEGDVYFNSVSHKLRFYNGTAWGDV